MFLLLALLLVLACGGFCYFFAIGGTGSASLTSYGNIQMVRPPARCPVRSPRTFHGPPSVHRRARTPPCEPSGLNHEMFALGKRRGCEAGRPPRSSARRRRFLPLPSTCPRRTRPPTSPARLPRRRSIRAPRRRSKGRFAAPTRILAHPHACCIRCLCACRRRRPMRKRQFPSNFRRALARLGAPGVLLFRLLPNSRPVVLLLLRLLPN